MDGCFIGAACFGIANQGDELSGQGVHRQADERLLADGTVDRAGHQRIPEGEVVGCSTLAFGNFLGAGVGYLPGLQPLAVNQRWRGLVEVLRSWVVLGWCLRDHGKHVVAGQQLL